MCDISGVTVDGGVVGASGWCDISGVIADGGVAGISWWCDC